MQTIHRFFNGPTPEERVRSWQTKLRSESRQLDREIRQVCVHIIFLEASRVELIYLAGYGSKKGSPNSEAVSD
jgi:hypothetical protein